jgi:hypothetical protein
MSDETTKEDKAEWLNETIRLLSLASAHLAEQVRMTLTGSKERTSFCIAEEHVEAAAEMMRTFRSNS